ncbi:GTPase-activating Rap/Ran-GAP domain-like protein 3 [Oncorhynchus masou masou]|uniref:GTPase-activating Rap/Ran-GAP domain-like protein 3 n=1 Tax=Oncorhynchus masou masou TaxID=90313 RepID=UPI0031839AAA
MASPIQPQYIGCHLYSINTHHGSELRIVAAIRNKLLLITRKQPRPDGTGALAATTDSPVDQFQYIREICLCETPVVMALVDGPTGRNDNMICVAYKHQFDLINESTGGRIQAAPRRRQPVYLVG